MFLGAAPRIYFFLRRVLTTITRINRFFSRVVCCWFKKVFPRERFLFWSFGARLGSSSTCSSRGRWYLHSPSLTGALLQGLPVDLAIALQCLIVFPTQTLPSYNSLIYSKISIVLKKSILKPNQGYNSATGRHKLPYEAVTIPTSIKCFWLSNHPEAWPQSLLKIRIYTSWGYMPKKTYLTLSHKPLFSPSRLTRE